ncbi:MAG: CBS domain-containing protein [bacterium]
MTAKEIMTTDLISLNCNMTLNEAYVFAQRHAQEYFPVVNENNELVGSLTQDDLLRAFYLEVTPKDTSLPTMDQLLAKIQTLLSTPISHHMSKDIVGVYPWMPVEWVGAQMAIYKLTAIPVVNKNKLLGVVFSKLLFPELMQLALSKKPAIVGGQTMLLERADDDAAGARTPEEIRIWRSAEANYDDKRAHKRVPIRIKVHYRLGGRAETAPGFSDRGDVFSWNISAGGMMLEFEDRPPSGILIYLQFSLHEGDSPIVSLSRVCWVKKSPDPGTYYAGIAFLAISSKERSWIDDCVEARSR